MNVPETGVHVIPIAYKPSGLGPVLGLGRSSVYKLIASGRLRSIRVGRRILVPADALSEFLKGAT